MAVRCALRIIEKNKLGFALIKPIKISDVLNKNTIAARLFSTGHVALYNIKQTDDEIVKRSIEVYSGPLASRVKRIKIFSLLTSGVGLLLQPVLIERWSTQAPNIPVAVAIFAFLGFHTYCTPVLLHLITKKYVVSLYYNEETDVYIARTYTLFLRNKLVFFKREDVEVPDVPGMFSSVLVKGEPFFIEMENFTDLEHYRKIMGYDKPIDFKLHTTEETLKQCNDKK